MRLLIIALALTWTKPIPPIDPCKRYVCAKHVKTISYQVKK